MRSFYIFTPFFFNQRLSYFTNYRFNKRDFKLLLLSVMSAIAKNCVRFPNQNLISARWSQKDESSCDTQPLVPESVALFVLYFVFFIIFIDINAYTAYSKPCFQHWYNSFLTRPYSFTLLCFNAVRKWDARENKKTSFVLIE